MAHDFAKRPQAQMKSASSLPGWVWFLTGLASGVFVSFLYYLSRDIPKDPAADAIVSAPSVEAGKAKVDEMEWDFYDIFPKSEVPIVEEYLKDGTKTPIAKPSAYLLQAGSFKDGADADRLRAELILLGLNAFTREVTTDGKKWHRVLVGPINSELELNRQKRTLAEANIASIALRVSP